MIKVGKDTVVAFRYTMKNGKGDLLEDKLQEDPVNYLQGSAVVQQLLQLQMEGLKAGDKKSVYLFSSTGLTTDDFVFDVIIDDVRPATEEEKFLGYPVHIKTDKCDTDCECYTTE